MGDMIAAVRTSHVGGRDPSKGELGLDCTRPRREPRLDLLLLELLLLMVRWSGCWARPGAAVSRAGRKEAAATAAAAAGLLPHSCCCCSCCSGCLAASCCVAWLQGLLLRIWFARCWGLALDCKGREDPGCCPGRWTGGRAVGLLSLPQIWMLGLGCVLLRRHTATRGDSLNLLPCCGGSG